MGTAYLKPILKATRPSQFRRIHLELAVACGHGAGDMGVAYTIIAPLDQNGRIDPMLWREFRDACRVARSRPGEDDVLGHLVYHLGGGWAVHYDWTREKIGFHLADERFLAGEHVSINDDGKTQTYRVVSVSHL